MKPIIRYAVVILLLTLVCQVYGWAAVQVSWTDAAGSHIADLELMNNPERTADPYSAEPLLCWGGAIDVEIADANPIELVCSGNFFDSEYDSGVWKLVRIEQSVLNSTGYSWNRFDITCADPDPDPDPSRITSFYNVNEWSPAEWEPLMDTQWLSYEMNEGGQYIANGGTFYDVIKVIANTDEYDNGGVILTKQAYGVAVPEPASFIYLLSGIAGLIALKKRQLS